MNASDGAFDDLLASWRVEGRDLVPRQWIDFDTLLGRVDAAAGRGRLEEAAAAAHVAAAYAVFWHCGVFVSHRLEAQIRRIGAAALPW
ncbi:MAG: hypothetical protein CVT71_01155, partial [Alphaproteobacteria bacterium HGW-Alphaproteobacteria-10]